VADTHVCDMRGSLSGIRCRKGSSFLSHMKGNPNPPPAMDGSGIRVTVLPGLCAHWLCFSEPDLNDSGVGMHRKPATYPPATPFPSRFQRPALFKNTVRACHHREFPRRQHRESNQTCLASLWETLCRLPCGLPHCRSPKNGPGPSVLLAFGGLTQTTTGSGGAQNGCVGIPSGVGEHHARPSFAACWTYFGQGHARPEPSAHRPCVQGPFIPQPAMSRRTVRRDCVPWSRTSHSRDIDARVECSHACAPSSWCDHMHSTRTERLGPHCYQKCRLTHPGVSGPPALDSGVAGHC